MLKPAIANIKAVLPGHLDIVVDVEGKYRDSLEVIEVRIARSGENVVNCDPKFTQKYLYWCEEGVTNASFYTDRLKSPPNVRGYDFSVTISLKSLTTFFTRQFNNITHKYYTQRNSQVTLPYSIIDENRR